ncbi:hypothetical protein QEN19_001409 [Hanseniaspora menglaensis]
MFPITRKLLIKTFRSHHSSRLISTKTYQDALSCLNSLQTNYKVIQEFKANSNNVRKTDQAIDEMKEYMRRLGYSNDLNELTNLNCIHITGTKGKGSTAAFANSILNAYNKSGVAQKDQLKIGLYTSPHLKTCRERIRINGKPISENLFTEYFFQVWDALNTTESDPMRFPDLQGHKKPGYFKFLTLLSFHTFIQENCNTCIFEVGIGGKYDSTNIIPNPTSAGLSLLGIDHVNVLGHTLKEICNNKVGIYKKFSTNFTILDQPEQEKMFEIMKQRQQELGCNNELNIIPRFEELEKINLGISGDFQVVNASLATALTINHLSNIHKLNKSFKTSTTLTNKGLEWSKNSKFPSFVIKGLEQCKWEGRCQTIPAGKITWFVDGAHTIDSIQKSSDWFVQKQVERVDIVKKRILFFNQQSRGENLEAFLTYIYKNMKSKKIDFDEIIFSTNKTWSEGYNADLISMNVSKEQVDTMAVQKQLKDIWLTVNDRSAQIKLFDSIEAGYNYVNKYNQQTDVFVTGSLHLVGGLLVVMDGK